MSKRFVDYDISNAFVAPRPFAVAAALVLVCVVPGSALAHGNPFVPGKGDKAEEASDKMAVRVQGQIRSRCAMGRGGHIDMGNLEVASEAEVSVGLTCNVPFILRISARHGEMVHSELPGGQGGYAGRVPYGVDIKVPLLNPSPSMMSGQYQGNQLRGGVALDSINAIAAGGAFLKFSTFDRQGDLLAGEYSETITMTIQPKM